MTEFESFFFNYLSKLSLIVLGLVVFIGIFWFIQRIKSNKKEAEIKVKATNKSKKIKLNSDVEGFDEVKRFNRDEYVEETFEQIFHAIKVDNWKSTSSGISNDVIEFKKDSVTLRVEYTCYNNFQIKSIELKTGYNSFYYISDLDESTYIFFYNIYSDIVRKRNEDSKNNVDQSLSEIHKALGKDTIRDGKIDQLLNG